MNLAEICLSNHNMAGKAFQNVIEQFMTDIVTHYAKRADKPSMESLQKIWLGERSKEPSPKAVPSKATSPKAASEKTSEDDGEPTGCPYRFIKGDRMGQRCGKKVNAATGFCTQHKDKADKVGKERKILPSKKSSESLIDDEKLLYKHKPTGKLWHKQTGLIFDSPQRRIVVGRIVDSELRPLTDEDVELCKRWSFPFERKEPKSRDNEDNEEKEEKDTKKEQKDTKKEEKPEADQFELFNAIQPERKSKFAATTEEGKKKKPALETPKEVKKEEKPPRGKPAKEETTAEKPAKEETGRQKKSRQSSSDLDDDEEKNKPLTNNRSVSSLDSELELELGQIDNKLATKALGIDDGDTADAMIEDFSDSD